MQNILLHNLTLPFKRYHPGIFNFDQNAIFFAEPGDLMITRAPIDASYSSFLDTIGCKMPNVEVISSQNRLRDPLSVFKDSQLSQDIRSKIKSRKSTWKLDSYMLTNEEASWAKSLGISILGDPSSYYRFNNKSLFRTIAKKHDFNIPAGFENRNSFINIAISAAALFIRGSSEIVIKQNEGVAGLGSYRVPYTKLMDLLSRPGDFFSEKLLGVYPKHSSGYVVERWHNNVVCSPSVQFYIDRQGLPKLISSHIQLFYPNKMTYRGCLSQHWLPNDMRNKLEREALRFASALSTAGLRDSYLSFNAIILDNGDLLWTEINPRRVSSSYAFQIAQRVSQKQGDLAYILYRVQNNSWRGFTVERLLRELQPVLFSQKSRKGIIPYDFGALYDRGETYLLALAENQNETELIFQNALSV